MLKLLFIVEVNPVEPANINESPVGPGAKLPPEFTQSALSFQFPLPLPIHVSVAALTVSEMLAAAVLPLLSVAVAVKVNVPRPLDAGIVIVPVQVPFAEVPLVSDKFTDVPPMAARFTETLVIVEAPPPATVTLMDILFWLRTAVDGVALLAEMFGGVLPE
jgi:hypothetical protein